MSRQRERERRGEPGRQHEKRRANAPRPVLRKSRLHRRLILFFAVMVVGALGLWTLVHRRQGPPPPTPISTAAMVDSGLTTYREQNWKEALHWARLLAADDPLNPSWVLHLGVVTHNYSFAWSKVGRVRSVTRTSLERIELESQALALMDSAAAWTRSDRQWTEAKALSGQVYEALGLPLEALQSYVASSTQAPEYQAAVPHVVFIERSLRDPPTLPSGSVSVRTP